MEKTRTATARETAFPTELRLRASDGEGSPMVIEGMAIVFDSPSVTLYEDDKIRIREIIDPNAVTEELLGRSDILLTLYHDDNRLLGRSRQGKGTMAYRRTERGVEFSCIPPENEDGRTARELVERGDITGCSFAYRLPDSPDAVSRTVRETDGKKEVTYTVLEIADIFDFTLTPRPAYRSTEVEARKRDIESARLELEGDPKPSEPKMSEEARRNLRRLRGLLH